MFIEQHVWDSSHGWTVTVACPDAHSAQLVFVFGADTEIKTLHWYEHIHQLYPHAHIVGCTAVAEISNDHYCEAHIVATAICFEKATATIVRTPVTQETSYSAGETLAEQLPSDGLSHIILFSEGVDVIGSDLVKGLMKHVPESVAVTGGMAGAHGIFEKCFIVDMNEVIRGVAIAIGLYGEVTIGYGSYGGWDSFGPERIITSSDKNVVYEIDERGALDLYKEYLGDRAKELPGAALLFPVLVKQCEEDVGIVRTVKGVDEKSGALIFSESLLEGSYVCLMKTHSNNLISGAEKAADLSMEPHEAGQQLFVLVVSCEGRKLILKQRTEEEAEVVRGVIGENAIMTGFYSAGEICPVSYGGPARFHNETMTITTIGERHNA